MITQPKYPHIRVNLSDCDGNAFAILGACRAAARAALVRPSELRDFVCEAMAGDYDNLLQTCMKWFEVD